MIAFLQTTFCYLVVQDMFVFALEENFKSPLDVPYFSGDYWPNVIEELLGILDKQTNSEKALEGNAMSCQVNTEQPSIWVNFLCLIISKIESLFQII